MKEIKTEYIRIADRVFMVEFSQGSNGFEWGINFEVFNLHNQPRTHWGRVRRFFSDTAPLAEGFWYPAGKYRNKTPYDMAVECCEEIYEKDCINDTVKKEWEKLCNTP